MGPLGLIRGVAHRRAARVQPNLTRKKTVRTDMPDRAFAVGVARLAAAALVLVGGASVPAVLAASPSAAPSIAPARPPANIQAWLDSEFVTPDAPPGGVLEAGFSFWDARQREFIDLGGADGVYVRMRPGTGSGTPSDATLEADFPGHVVADILVPEGGPGDVEVGMLIPACIEGGGCADVQAPFAIAGVGPPPDAPPEQLITAELLPLVGDTVAGREFAVSVNIAPRGLWAFDALPLPDHLVVVARQPGGPELSTGEVSRTGASGTPYAGRLTIPEPGPAEIAVAIPLDAGGTREIEGSAIERTVLAGALPSDVPGATAAPASPPSEPSSDPLPPVAWILGIGTVLVVAVVVLRRALADL